MNHNPKNSFEARQRALIEDNINVSKTNEVKDLFILLAGVIAIIFVLIFSFDLCASIYIDKMPYTSQSKIEETLE